MAVIDLTNVRAVIEADGKVRCVNCIDGKRYWRGLEPEREIIVTRDDLEDPDRLYICDCCGEVL